LFFFFFVFLCFGGFDVGCCFLGGCGVGFGLFVFLFFVFFFLFQVRFEKPVLVI